MGEGQGWRATALKLFQVRSQTHRDPLPISKTSIYKVPSSPDLKYKYEYKYEPGNGGTPPPSRFSSANWNLLPASFQQSALQCRALSALCDSSSLEVARNEAGPLRRTGIWEEHPRQ